MDERSISAEEFHRAIEGLRQYVGERCDGIDGNVNQRCDGIDGRLDKVNGRLDRHGNAIGRLEPLVARHDERLQHQAQSMATVRAAVAEPALPAELKELLEFARDLKGGARISRWLYAIVGGLVPIVLWLAALKANGWKVWP
jgi:hypothetical protein